MSSTSPSKAAEAADEHSTELCNGPTARAPFDTEPNAEDGGIKYELSDRLLRLTTKKNSLGKYQMLCYSIISMYFMINLGWINLAVTFMGEGDSPSYHCNYPEGENISDWIPEDTSLDGKRIYSPCLMYKNGTDKNETEACQNGWHYNTKLTSTLITEFELVCDKKGTLETGLVIASACSFIGSLVVPSFADKYGRKNVFVVTTFICGIFSTCKSFAPNFVIFVLFACLDELLKTGAGSVGISLCVELFPVNQRTFAGTALEYFWVGGCMLLPWIAYGLRDWRHLNMTISVPLLTAVFSYWILLESTPWLVSNKKNKEVEQVITRMAKFNGVKLPEDVWSAVADTDTEEAILIDPEEKIKKLSPLDIFRKPKFTLYVFIMFFLWLVNGMVFYGMNLLTSYLAGDLYLNNFLSMLAELPAYILCYFIMEKYGRRIPTVVFHMIAAVGLLGSVVETTEWGKNQNILLITLFLIGKFGITGSFAIIVLYGPEIYPTNLRGLGSGICNGASRLAGLILPYSSLYLAKINPWLPKVLYGLLSIIVGLSALYLPEPLGQPLPETIDEVLAWKRTIRRSKRK